MLETRADLLKYAIAHALAEARIGVPGNAITGGAGVEASAVPAKGITETAPPGPQLPASAPQSPDEQASQPSAAPPLAPRPAEPAASQPS